MRVPVKTHAGTTFFVEVDAAAPDAPSAPGLPDASDAPELAPDGAAMGAPRIDTALFARAVEVVQSVSQDLSEGLLATEPRPSSVELALDLGFDAQGNVWIFRGGAKASLKLTLRWNLPPSDGGDGSGGTGGTGAGGGA